MPASATAPPSAAGAAAPASSDAPPAAAATVDLSVVAASSAAAVTNGNRDWMLCPLTKVMAMPCLLSSALPLIQQMFQLLRGVLLMQHSRNMRLVHNSYCSETTSFTAVELPSP